MGWRVEVTPDSRRQFVCFVRLLLRRVMLFVACKGQGIKNLIICSTHAPAAPPPRRLYRRNHSATSNDRSSLFSAGGSFSRFASHVRTYYIPGTWYQVYTYTPHRHLFFFSSLKITPKAGNGIRFILILRYFFFRSAFCFLSASSMPVFLLYWL